MITSTKTILKTKHNKKTDRQNPRTNVKAELAIQTKSHKEAYTYTLPKGERGKIYI